MVKRSVCVFISGKGSNLDNLIKRSRDYNFPISVKLVICNKKDALGIKYAKKNSIPFILIDTKNKSYENLVLYKLKEFKIELICLAGFMKVISKNFLRSYRKKIINIHPSLLPKYRGLNTFEKVLKNKDTKTGCTIHYVNEKLDAGKVIVQKKFYVDRNDNIITLKKKTQNLEYLAYPEAVIKIFRNC